MKLTEIKTHIYEVDMPRKMGDANSPRGRKRSSNVILELITDEGLTGISTTGFSTIPFIKSMFNTVLVNEDPVQVRGLWKRMIEIAFKGGHYGVVNDAISALDIALWDLKAKINNEPLWKTLGGLNPKVKSYASGIEMPLSDHDLKKWYESMAAMGVDGGKINVGLNQDDDIRRIGIMKEALSVNTPNPMLLIDSNEYWSPKQAIRFIREIEEHFDITWAEEPARRWDFIGLKKISDSVKTAVCAGENIDTLGEFLPYFHHQSADIIQVSSGMGGITCALQIADAAYGFDLPVTLGGSAGHLHAHLATSIPNFMIMEVSSEFPDPVLSTEIKFEEGNAILGNEPGIGFKINWDKLEDLKTENPSRVSGPSPYGRRSGAGLYQVKASPEEIKEAQEK